MRAVLLHSTPDEQQPLGQSWQRGPTGALGEQEPRDSHTVSQQAVVSMKLMSHLKVLCSKMTLTVRDRVSTISLADSICGISTMFSSCFRRWYLQQ